MTRDPGTRPPLPDIEGYRVWHGRALLHARCTSTYAEARAYGRPWHVVAPTPERLIEAVARGQWQA